MSAQAKEINKRSVQAISAPGKPGEGGASNMSRVVLSMALTPRIIIYRLLALYVPSRVPRIPLKRLPSPTVDLENPGRP